MAINGGLQITILFASCTAQAGYGFQLRFCQIGTPFNQPRLAQIFANLRIARIKSQRALIIPDTFVGTPEFSGGITLVIPSFSGIGLFQTIQQCKRCLIFAFLRHKISIIRLVFITQARRLVSNALFTLTVVNLPMRTVWDFYCWCCHRPLPVPG